MKRFVEIIPSAKMEIRIEKTIILMDRDFHVRNKIRIHSWTKFNTELHKVNIEYRLESGAILWSRNGLIFDPDTNTFSPFEDWILTDDATNKKVGKFNNQQAMTKYVKRQLCR